MKKIFLDLKKEAGFTLIEMLIGIVILSLMIGTVSLTLAQNYQEKAHTEKLIQSTQQLRALENTIINELRYATAGNGFTTSTSSISYNDLNNQPCQIVWNNSTKQISITNNSTNTIKTTLNAPNIETIKFQKDTTDTTNRTVIITFDTKDCRTNYTSQNVSKIRMLN